MPAAAQIIHRVYRQQNGEVQLGLLLRHREAKIQLAAPFDHVFQNLVDRVLILSGPTGDLAAHFPAKPVEKRRRRGLTRLRGSIVIPTQSVEKSVAEIERCAKDKRFVQVLLLVGGEIPLGRRQNWPIYAAAEKHGLPVGIHAGSMFRYAPTSTGWPSHHLHDHAAQSQIFEDQLLSLVSHGVFNRFPTLKFVLMESGVTWLPSFIWRAIKTWRGVRAEVPWVNRSPAEIIRDNIRFQEASMGDLRSQMAACRLAERRLEELFARYGKDVIFGAIERIFSDSEAKCRRIVSEMPDGVYEAESFLDPDGADKNDTVPVRVKVIVSGSDMTIDLSGCSPEREGGANSRTFAGAYIAEIIRAYLEREGFRTVHAGDGRTALDATADPVTNRSESEHTEDQVIFEIRHVIDPAMGAVRSNVFGLGR